MNNVVTTAEAFLAALRMVDDDRISGDVHHAREAVMILVDAMDATGVLDDVDGAMDMPVQVAA